ncbi:MAG: TIGR03862 family flavoprotein [Nitrosomonadales bacterium]|nr:TIGR03862 family flavoprotein [Nitrosomonadales bacterium]
MKNQLHEVAIIGGGPAGLMAAEVLIQGGARVHVYDAMPTAGRKFLMAGKGGMNITHAEPAELFLSRYGARSDRLKPMLDAFGPEALRAWAQDLGIATFVGSSGRVFPVGMKAAPLLRAWLHRLREAGVHFHMRHRWCGWSETTDRKIPSLRFVMRHVDAAPSELAVQADAVVLALGGGSWPQLGSDGTWVPLLAQHSISVTPLQPANCGFDVGWSAHFIEKFAGQPVKAVSVTFSDAAGKKHRQQGDLMVTAHGVEGGLIYALSAPLRNEIAEHGSALIHLDLVPGKELSRLVAEIAHPRGSRSMSSHLQSRANIKGVKTGLLRELLPAEVFHQPEKLAATIKSLPLRLIAPRPLEEAISSAGGVTFAALDDHLMMRAIPGVFCAGEMLDWEAPTGGYLLTACFASGRYAGQGALNWLKGRDNPTSSAKMD